MSKVKKTKLPAASELEQKSTDDQEFKSDCNDTPQYKASACTLITMLDSDHPWNTEPDAAEIMIATMKAGNKKRVLEIGTCVGVTSKRFSNAGFQVTTLDIEDQRHPEVVADDNIRFILGTVDNLPLVKPNYDAAFIDGDHSYEGCAKDFKVCEQLGIPLIFIHDAIHIEGVNKFVKEQEKNPHYHTIILDTSDGDGLAIIKRK